MKREIWRWFKEVILRLKFGELLPWYFVWMRWLVFPILSIRFYQYTDFMFEPWNDRMTIFGVDYSLSLFEHFAKADDRPFQIINKDDKKVTIRIIDGCHDCPMKPIYPKRWEIRCQYCNAIIKDGGFFSMSGIFVSHSCAKEECLRKLLKEADDENK